MKNKLKQQSSMLASCKPILNIVADATINNIAVSYGKTIPLVILDTTEYQSIDKVILAHRDISQGSVTTQWMSSKDYKYIFLNVDLKEPVACSFIIKFDSRYNAALVDIVVNSQQLYIQGGALGDRLKNDLSKPRLLIDVPSTNFCESWDRIYTHVYTSHFQSLGYSKKEAQELSKELRDAFTTIRDLRLKK